MKVNSIKCEAVNVKTDTGVCAGIAKTKLGEQFIIDGRTPVSPGMCSNAFCALSNEAFIMMATGEKQGNSPESIDRICPDGLVTFRLSRSENDKETPYNSK